METARERFRRIQAETAKAGAEAGAPGVVERGGAITVDEVRARILRRTAGPRTQERRDTLAGRMRALGAPVLPHELPQDDADLADLERFCAEQERNAQ